MSIKKIDTDYIEKLIDKVKIERRIGTVRECFILGYNIVYNENRPIICKVKYKEKEMEFVIDEDDGLVDMVLDSNQISDKEFMLNLINSIDWVESYDGNVEKFLRKVVCKSIPKKIVLRKLFKNAMTTHERLCELFI